MTAADEFHFRLLRVSMLQLLRARGFDCCKPSTLDTLTDLCARFLSLLATEVHAAAAAAARTTTTTGGDDPNAIALQDISLALANVGLLRPRNILDVHDENPELASDDDDAAMNNWLLYIKSNENTRSLALPPIDTVKTELNNYTATATTTTAAAGASSSSLANAHNKPHGFTIGPDKSRTTVSNNPAAFPNNNPAAFPNNNPAAFPNNNPTASLNAPNDLEDLLDRLIDQLIDNGDTDDWIKFNIARQRLALFHKRVTQSAPAPSQSNTTLPADIAALPNINALKHSAMNACCYSTQDPNAQARTYKNEFIPIIHEETDDTKTTEYIQKAKRFNTLLPAMRTDTRLQNIALSYDNIDDTQMKTTTDNIATDLSTQQQIINDEMDYDDIESSQFQLNLQQDFTEIDDMDNTFQRRQSLDYGNSF